MWKHRDTTKCGAGRICGTDLIVDNLQISRAYLRISDHCRVRVRVRVWVRVRVTVTVRIKVRVGVMVSLCSGLQTVVYKLLEKATKGGSIT